MKRIIAPLAGALITLSLAPFHYWPLAIVSMAALAWCLDDCTAKEGFLRGWLFGSASFLAGVSWIYVAMYVYGNTSALLSAVMTILFCLGLGLVTGLFAYVYSRWLRDGKGGRLLGFAAAWVIVEWFRGWFLTGFPWLYLGYSQLETPLSGWAPVVGVYGLSFAVALSGAALCHLLTSKHKANRWLPVAGCIALFGLGASMQTIEWTQATQQPPLRVGAVQSNITQEKKWAYSHYWDTLELYDVTSEQLWPNVDVVIWPEAAIPALYRNAETFFDYIRERAAASNTALITGVPTKQGDNIYNSAMVINGGEGLYHKQRLVPFGEYVPLGSLLRGLIGFFDLPMSSFSRGDADQRPLSAKGWQFAPSICYEIVYPNLVARGARDADILFTISNDAWFGDSIGPAQHMQMAQMRALENGRELIRVTSTGITAIVDQRGQITTRIPSFTHTTMTGEVNARSGRTPFNYAQSTPIIALCFALALTALRRRPVQGS
ncbi:apolipoprotein N-acyltransferase [Spongiibacter marinus]|uniref:apolipoprotein N-acyltransferase n=1 Tax=Spongiibacter marinus TaxID=354246 RepID=UPI000403E8B7|nr:apolipoprotein N-acyltransferase [Spongiibacter marinus]